MTRPTLYVMLGYPGAGKTTAAHAIHEVTGAVHLWADQIRRELFPFPSYSEDEHQQVYARMNATTDKMLGQGKSVVFDTNFRSYKDREYMRRIAARNNAQCVVVWVQVPEHIARERATKDAHAQQTRVLGNMPIDKFEYLTTHTHPPKSGEKYIAIDGTKVTNQYIKTALDTYKG